MIEKVNPSHPDNVADKIAITKIGGFEKFVERGLL